MTGPATAMICYQYAFKISPTLKNICSYLHDAEGTVVDLYVETTYCRQGEPCQWPGVQVIDSGADPFYRYFGRPLLRMDQRRQFLRVLEKNIGRYRRFFAVDFQALQMLYEVGADLSSVVFLSLESSDYMLRYDKAHVTELLTRCALRVVQSRERGDDLNKYLCAELLFEYLPVSSRYQPLPQAPPPGKLRLLYTGYFAEWACLTEFLEAYRKSGVHERTTLLLQGHALGTENYQARVAELADAMPDAAVDSSYYTEAAHASLIAGYDAGLAFYQNLTGSANFDNLILSSGKIAAYLWSGLPVLTNIRCDLSGRPPFVYVDLEDPATLKRAVDLVDRERDAFRRAAYEMANRVYHFDRYMSVLHEKMPGQATAGKVT